jgi:hypothetical protein
VVSAVVISSTLGLILTAQVATSQTLDGSAAGVRPNAVRPATRHQTPQLSAKNTLVGDPTTRPQLPTPNCQLPTRPYGGFGLKSALQDARFGEASGRNLNSPVVDGAAIVVPPEQVDPAGGRQAPQLTVGPATDVRPVRRHQAPQLRAKDVTVDDANAPSRRETPSLDVRKVVKVGARTALQDMRFGEAMLRGGNCYPWGCGENSPVVGGAAVTGPIVVMQPGGIARRN